VLNEQLTSIKEQANIENKRAQLGLQSHHPTEWTERRSGYAVKLTTGLMP
jgi:CRISPR/Cas system CMR-associated protein Cmr1 (group 7 of RAMP superfamily)